MIYTPQFESLAEELRIYDVVDGGWERDPEAAKNPLSVNRNLTHVVFHLSDVIERKNFWDEGTVESEIAPDSLQYAMRFVRWGGLALRETFPDAKLENEIIQKSDLLGIGESLMAVMMANAELARNRHDADHKGSKNIAKDNMQSTMKRAASLLIFSSVEQAETYEFNLEDAFTTRLQNLRERFNIPRSKE